MAGSDGADFYTLEGGSELRARQRTVVGVACMQLR